MLGRAAGGRAVLSVGLDGRLIEDVAGAADGGVGGGRGGRAGGRGDVGQRVGVRTRVAAGVVAVGRSAGVGGAVLLDRGAVGAGRRQVNAAVRVAAAGERARLVLALGAAGDLGDASQAGAALVARRAGARGVGVLVRTGQAQNAVVGGARGRGDAVGGEADAGPAGVALQRPGPAGGRLEDDAAVAVAVNRVVGAEFGPDRRGGPGLADRAGGVVRVCTAGALLLGDRLQVGEGAAAHAHRPGGDAAERDGVGAAVTVRAAVGRRGRLQLRLAGAARGGVGNGG